MVITVQPSFIRPGLGSACTLCIHHGTAMLTKVCRDEREAWNLAAALDLISPDNPTGLLGDPAVHPLLRALKKDAEVSLDDLHKRGFN
jgi:hypothetical protein